jgi:hypothetical protein
MMAAVCISWNDMVIQFEIFFRSKKEICSVSFQTPTTIVLSLAFFSEPLCNFPERFTIKPALKGTSI